MTRILYLFLLLLGAFGAELVCRSKTNVLALYPELRSAKTALGKGLNGAVAFTVTPTALERRALNLGAWFGHQEVELDKDWFELPRLRLKAFLRGHGDVEVILRGKNGNAAAFRISNHPLHPSAWLELEGAYEFRNRAWLAYEAPAGRWMKVSLHPVGTHVQVEIDGKKFGSFPAPQAPMRIAFRGSSDEGIAQIDDVEISGGGQTYLQSFSGTFNKLLFLVLFVLGATVLFRIHHRHGYGAALITAASIAVVGIVPLSFLEWIGPRYPFSANLQGAPARIETREAALQRLGQVSQRGPKIVLWLGGSQAWGAGASDGARTAFSLLMNRLAAGSEEWVNGAISGAKALDQLEALRAFPAQRRISRVILLTGVNDTWNDHFAEDLKMVLNAVRARGARLFLIAEPSEPPVPPRITNRRKELLRFAREQGVPYFNPQEILERRVDEGFVWWDFVHLTDFGAKLEAEAVEPALRSWLRDR